MYTNLNNSAITWCSGDDDDDDDYDYDDDDDDDDDVNDDSDYENNIADDDENEDFSHAKTHGNQHFPSRQLFNTPKTLN